MEKNYAERVIDIKNEIVNEIREIIPSGTEIHFYDEEFYIHYVEGEIATTEICKAVMKCRNGNINLLVGLDYEEESIIEEDRIPGYEPESLIDILNHTEKAIREQKIGRLRDLVKKAGGEISFDGNFKFNGEMDDFDIDECGLSSLQISRGSLVIKDTWQGQNYVNDEDFLPTEELDKIIAYVEEKTKESFALTDEQNAAVDELAKAVKKIKDSGLKILIDYVIGDLVFINPNGRSIEIVAKGEAENVITDMAEDFNCVDYMYSSDSDDISVI